MPSPSPRSSPTPARLDRGLLALFALSAFAAAGTIHYQTPMLVTFAAEFGADPASAGWVATLSFGGFLAGTVFLVPLGDRVDKRGLILIELSILIVALLAMAAAPSLPTLAVAALAVGVTATYPQVLIPLAAELAPSDSRGRVLGTILASIFLGILFARLAGGFAASYVGWRWIYVIAAAMLLAHAPLLVARLPGARPRSSLAYVSLIASLARLLRGNATLRRASTTQFLLGISYGGFWATAAPMLAQLHGFGPVQTGLMAIPGATGLLLARPAGRWTDVHGAFPVVTTGIVLVLSAYVVFGFAAFSVAAVVGGAMLLDCDLRAALVANQTLITSVATDARSRFNTVFGAHIWGGNAVGAFFASTALAHSGWLMVCAVALSASSLALAVQWRSRTASAV